ncbi:ABC transporter substrate-binding protein [Streptomyces avermitilis]|uniref:Peptide ABC transporter substrate-binding protein n=2 Tax=Streptomyces avermitilis TaxID=33903 RepID=Q82IP3_STRAW|nr:MULTISPECIES: ABC transporter substrate-binding protein [Streptomyces]KUN56309.1 ABC transporter substrate-binding protein [Streptomyces avermitilis]MYS98686.1 ABC transporter substrate-binding protein [Streptomyces sp. SID5469]OOV32964.1 ABC transporter substrate-binding protein [Streptomyces avermitilis]BAC70801.1 putative peptide ABC transporter substrate-binding protein [Streptomyces avermitilis MA-4680 = NBRC 14893]BBJ50943.1 ABC transporter substrate-binding protein [Streptomyces aver
MRHPSVIARRVAAASVSLVVAAGAAACGPEDNDAKGAGGDSTPRKGGTLTVLNSNPQEDFDPGRLYTSGGGNVPSLVFRTLTTRNREDGAAGAEVVPDLATDTGRPSKNATVWTYTLKEGLKYEDGAAITSADIKYGIERSFAPELSGGAPYLRDWLVGAADYQGPYKDKKGLSAIETPDERTIVFHLNKPEGEFPYLATQTQFTPVPKAKDNGTKYEEHPISSGPYKVVKNENDGERLTLERNTYWSAATDAERKAYPAKIDVRSGLDSSVINQRLSASQGADATAVTTDTNLGPAELAKVTGDKALAARVGTGHFGYTDYIAFNPKVKPFNNAKVRQAISYAIDRSSVINAAGGSSLAEAATTYLPNQKSFGYTPYDHFPAGTSGNPAKAKELLKEAGYKNGLTISLTHSNSKDFETSPEIATAVQDALKKAGITVKLQGLEENDYKDKIHSVKTEPGFFLAHWGADWPSGGPFLAPIFDGRQIVKDGANFNTGFLDDKSVNAEIDAINKLTDLDAAAKRWGALDQKIGEQALTVPLFHPVYKRLYGSAVKNIVISDWTGVLDISQVSVK